MTYAPRRGPLRRPHGLPPLRRQRPAAAGHLARPLAQLRRRHRRTRPSGRSAAPPSTSASPTSTSPTTTARRRARPRPPSARSSRTDFARLPRRADHLDQGRLPDVARPLRRVGQPQVPDSPRLDQSLKRMGLDYVDIFYSHRFDPDTPLEETMGALDAAVRAGKALYAGISSYNSEQDPRGGGDPEGPRHPLPDPPAELQHDQPLGGARRPEGDAEGARHRLDRLHPARPGHADREVPEGHPRGQPRHPGQVAAPRVPERARHRATSARSTRSPSAAARPSPRWRSPGCCATAASPRR